jgi:hypothetical protein
MMIIGKKKKKKRESMRVCDDELTSSFEHCSCSR